MGGAFSHFCCIDLCHLWSLTRRSTSPPHSERSDYAGDEAEASSSSPPVVREDGFQYDVFLSFRGADTRNGFTYQLYHALKDKGIQTFIDSEKLEKGQEVNELLGCIERSKIFVPIFSKGYADSTWCLKEIAKVVECKRLILPVFTDVEPRDVGHQTGPFASAFERHRKEIGEEEVSKWSHALTKAGKISGYNLAETHGNETRLVQLIVKDILREVYRTSQMVVAKHPVGLDYRITDLMKMLDVEAQNDATMVGIHGMGGIGKTTLAMAAFNKISTCFDGYSFIANVREKAKQSQEGLISLQKILLKDIFNHDHVSIISTDHGIGIIQHIKSKKVLLVLDDVDDAKQLGALAGSTKWFCAGSRIIITTRDKGVLREQRVNLNLYELKGLDDTQSLELFSWHAFGAAQPVKEFAEYSKIAASTADGLPLALTIFGSHFFDLETVKEWEDMIQMLKDKDIHERLKISYDALDKNAQKIFLDIACFFVGKNLMHPTLMWEDCGFYPNRTIKVLMHKSLINIKVDTGNVEMHDLIRDMGRKIVQDESLQNQGLCSSRLWKDDDTQDLLQKNRGTKHVEAIQYDPFWHSRDIETGSFVAMNQLRMLLLGYEMTLKGEYECFPAKALRWLKWHTPSHLESLPGALHLENIVILDLSGSHITQLWKPQGSTQDKVFGKLKVLNLSCCYRLTICPDFTIMPHLEMLDFHRCGAMSKLDPSIGLLKSLTKLDLSFCESLRKLPQEVWQLTSLEKLDLCYCHQIITLPLLLGNSKTLKQPLSNNLKVLNFSCCTNLAFCPNFPSMPHLERLDFSGCKRMGGLRPSIGSLRSLTHLSLSQCHSLQELPKEVWQLTSLEELELRDCSLQELPEEVWQLTSFEELELRDCHLTHFPSLLKNSNSSLLNKLRVLDLSLSRITTCPNFTRMPHLKRLDFTSCKMLSELHPSVGLLKRLTHLSLKECKSLTDLPQEVWQLTSLEELDLCGCLHITSLPSLLGVSNSALLDKLRVLDLSDCQHFTTCPDFTRMPHLKRLSFSSKKLSELHPSVGFLKNLTHLSLRKCKALKELPQEIWQLTSLEEFDLGFCCQITTLPPKLRYFKSLKQPLLHKLKVLNFSCCNNLTRCPDFLSMPHLERLDFSGCKRMSELHPSIGSFKSLFHLNLRACHSLNKLPQEVWLLNSLKVFDLSCCCQITTLPSKLRDSKSLTQPLLDKLKVLNFSDCENLTICPDFPSMPHLERLYFSNCRRMNELHPSIGSFNNLTHLNLSQCHSLEELPQEVWELTSLKSLSLEGSSLKELPEKVSQLTSLEWLDLSGCNNITTFHESIGQLKSLRKLISNRTAIEELPESITLLDELKVLAVAHCGRLKLLPRLPPSLIKFNATTCFELEMIADVSNAKMLRELDLSVCQKLVDVPSIEKLEQLNVLMLQGCGNLHDSFWQRFQEANFPKLRKFSSPGRQIDDGSSDPQSLSFLAPRQFKTGLLYLYVDKSSRYSICSELGRSNDAYDLEENISQTEEEAELHCIDLEQNEWSIDKSSQHSNCSELDRSYSGLELADLDNIGLELDRSNGSSEFDVGFSESEENLDLYDIGSEQDRSNGASELHEGISESDEGPDLDDIGLEQDRRNGASELDEAIRQSDDGPDLDDIGSEQDELSIENVDVPPFCVGKVVRIDITTADGQLSFSTSIKYKWDGKHRRVPTATVRFDSFMGDDDAKRGTMMMMDVSIDGCVLLRGDLTTTTGYFIEDRDMELGENIVIVDFSCL